MSSFILLIALGTTVICMVVFFTNGVKLLLASFDDKRLYDKAFLSFAFAGFSFFVLFGFTRFLSSLEFHF